MILPFIFLAIGVCFHHCHGSNLYGVGKSDHQKQNVLKASHAIFTRSDIFHPILWHHCCYGNYWLAAFAFAATGDFFWQWLWARIMMTLLAMICGITSHIEGDMPDGQVIYAVKHQSAWETIVLLALLGQPVTVMKRSLLLFAFGLYLAHGSGSWVSTEAKAKLL